MRIGIEVDHSVPRYKSIRKLNYFRGETSIIVLKGKAAGKQHKVDESGKRCKGLKTPSVVPDLTDKVIMLSTPDFSVA